VDGGEADAFPEPKAIETAVRVLGQQEQRERLSGLLWTESDVEEQALDEGGSGEISGLRMG